MSSASPTPTDYGTIEAAIGRTPLVRLQRLGREACDARGNVVLGKLEGNNPAGSVKDRPALSMIQRAVISSLAIPWLRRHRGIPVSPWLWRRQ
jgi:hypothetical protein